MKEALFYEKLAGKSVDCKLCPHSCRIKDGGVGFCKVRTNQAGILYTTNYANTVTVNLDPIEKKPLYHFHPKSEILSLGSNSCNLTCDYCQNYTISQYEAKTLEISPEKLLNLCLKDEIIMVAFTYTEPVTWYEYVLETAKLLSLNSIKTVFVTNGFINQEPLVELLPYIDAMNIDLKAMTDDFYKDLCSGSLEPVLNTIKTAYKHCHIEITNLIIPGENDRDKEIEALVDFIAEIDINIPLHFSRYFPQFQRSTSPTPITTMETAKAIAKKKLNYVYLGNILTDSDTNTHCPNCNALLIERNHYQTQIVNLINNKCSTCLTEIYGIFNKS